METTRIKYKSVGQELHMSRQVYLLPEGIQVKILLNYNDFKYTILNAISYEVVASGGRTKNKAVLKLQAKKALTKLGATFSKEERPSRRKNQQKGTDSLETQN